MFGNVITIIFRTFGPSEKWTFPDLEERLWKKGVQGVRKEDIIHLEIFLHAVTGQSIFRIS